MIELFGEWFNVNVAVIRNSNDEEFVGIGPLFSVPKIFIKEIKDNGLGSIMNKIFDKKNLKIGLGGFYNLSNGSISRIHITKEAVIMALSSCLNEESKDSK